MVTVTNADVKVRYLAEWPAGVSDATVTALCTRAETFVQSKAGTGGTFPLTTAAGIELCVDLIVKWIEYAKYMSADGAATGLQAPVIWTREMQERFNTIMMEDAGMVVEDTIDFNVS